MLQFVLISSSKKSIKGYELEIDKLLIKEDADYKCYNYNLLDDDLHNFIKEVDNERIYLIEDSQNIPTLNILKTIRNSYNDLNSFIVILDEKNNIKRDYIEEEYYIHTKVVNDINKISDVLKQVIKVYLNKTKKLSYQYNGCFYNIDLSKILYIEKQLESKICNLICLDGVYSINNTIKGMDKILTNNFVRTHQSAIVNINNVEMIDFNKKIITFSNKETTNLFSRNYKKKVKEVITKKCQKVTE